MGRRLERKLRVMRILNKVRQQCKHWSESKIIERQVELRREIFNLNNVQHE